jgi:uncharacterized protein (TIGR02172 family)
MYFIVMEKVDLSKWIMFSDRHNSENYNSPDGKWMLKLGFPGFCSTKEELLREQAICRKVFALGIPTPQVGEIVEQNGRLGMIYERITGKRSISRCIGEEPEKLEQYIKIFAEKCKMLHSTACVPGDFENVEKKYLRFLEKSRLITGDIAEYARKLIDDTPVKITCLHGDLQTGNLIINDKSAFFIDLGEFAYGNPLYDLGCYYYFCHYLPDDYLMAAHYMNASRMRKCWDVFAKYYFDADTPEKLAAVDARVKPYVLFPILDFEHLLSESENIKYLEKNFQAAKKDLGF